MSSPINLVFKFTVSPKDVERVTQLADEICSNVHKSEPGTLLYYIYKVDGKCEFVAVERYQDQAAFEAHMSQPYFVKFADEITPLIQEEQELGQGLAIAGFTHR